MTSKMLNYRYRVIQELGEGGFGSTFLAEDTQMPSGRRCVIKQLKPVTYNPQIQQLVQQRFQREAAILEDLGRHSQIPTLYAYFQEDEQFYLVQEWVEGKTLSAKVEREGKLSESAVRDILKNILPVLNFVHSKRIVHRDIKPDNIILRDADNKPVLIDFGAVRETMGTVVTSQGGTASSIVIGTPGFMPAEQAAGRPVYSSDLYSIGLTAIYLLTGKMPQELETDHRTGEIMWHQEALAISPSLASVLDKAIEPNARDRYESPKQMLDALQPSSSSVPSSPPQFVPPTVANQPQNYAPPTEIPPAVNPYPQPSHGEQNPHQQPYYQSSTPYQQPANPYQTPPPPYQGQNPYQQQPSYQPGQQFSSGPVGGGGTFNTSVPVPHEIQGWNWGAFLAPQFWPFSNRVWIGLLAWVPIANMVMPFILGAKGNAWGWRSRQWQSLQDFKGHQKTWTIAGLFLCIPLFFFNTYVNTKFLEAIGADTNSSSEQSINSSPSAEPQPSNSPVTSSSTNTEPVSNSNGDTTNWVAYSSQSGNYSARFPAQPTEQKQNADSIEFILVGYSDNANKRFYGTAESEVPLPSGATFDVQKGLDGARDSAAKSTNATVISEQQITQNGYPGREITMRGQNNLGIIQRMVVDPDGPTLYQAIVVAEDGNLTFPEARAFLDSLTID